MLPNALFKALKVNPKVIRQDHKLRHYRPIGAWQRLGFWVGNPAWFWCEISWGQVGIGGQQGWYFDLGSARFPEQRSRKRRLSTMGAQLRLQVLILGGIATTTWRWQHKTEKSLSFDVIIVTPDGTCLSCNFPLLCNTKEHFLNVTITTLALVSYLWDWNLSLVLSNW